MAKRRMGLTVAGIFAALSFMFASGSIFRAQADDLTLVPPALVPASGTFYSLQKGDSQPPFPFNPFPDSPVYFLGDGVFLFDDSGVAYSTASIDPNDSEPGGDAGGSREPTAAFNYTCGLWLSISVGTNNAVLLGLHNTRPGQNYVVWSITNIVSTNWVVETNVTGASGNLTGTFIAMGQRTNLFLRASEARDYVMVTNFTGLGFSENGLNPPDTMGAVGPNHFVELLNSQTTNFVGIRVYDKTGTLVAQTNSLDFFRIGTNYPTGSIMADPRIFYDQQSHRWVATALDSQGSQHVILAVSNGDSPTNLVTGWSRYLLPVHSSGRSTDFPTLGMDANGLYVSVLQSGDSTNSGHTVMAIKKPELYQGTFIGKKIEITNGLPVQNIQPAVNFDDVPTNGYAWFVVKGPPDFSTNYAGGALCYRRLQWSGTNASMDTNWFILTNTVVNYRDYYDLDGTNTTGAGVHAPQTNGSPIDLYQTGSRWAVTVLRNGLLWTCQAIGLSGTNGVYAGDQFGTNVDRTGVQWLKLGVDAANGSLSYSAHGRVYDRKASNPLYYYFPSLMVNCAGDMVIGFSGSSATNYISAYYTWRLGSGAALDTPRLIRAGLTNYVVPQPQLVRLGDYSATTLDPTDDWGFWTVQQYADPGGAGFLGINPWKTVVARIRPNP